LAEIKRNDRRTHNMKRERLLRKYKIEANENLDQSIEELKQKYQQRHSDCLDIRKGKNSITKIKCLEQTARNFTTFSDTQIPCGKSTKERGDRELLENNIRGRRNVLDQKPASAKSIYGL
jgi:hypothetical protein